MKASIKVIASRDAYELQSHFPLHTIVLASHSHFPSPNILYVSRFCVFLRSFPHLLKQGEEHIHGPLFFALIFMYILKLRIELMSATSLFSILLSYKHRILSTSCFLLTFFSF